MQADQSAHHLLNPLFFPVSVLVIVHLFLPALPLFFKILPIFQGLDWVVLVSWSITGLHFPFGSLFRITYLLLPPRCVVSPLLDYNLFGSSNHVYVISIPTPPRHLAWSLPHVYSPNVKWMNEWMITFKKCENTLLVAFRNIKTPRRENILQKSL